ncbi:7-cyano-7-deazaguanine synthase QueC [candidate division WOR-3 bacterium]|nr:7-cyano-7-deazaguanine synthase QueC [candidate division WOR-3 bacterium]
MIPKKAVVLLSGGLDSSVLLAFVIKKEKMLALPMVFDYGQRHRIEIESAKKVARSQGCEPVKIFSIDLSSLKGSSLTDLSLEVPDNKEIGSKLPNTYVPARNLIFLSISSAWAEVSGAEAVYYGANAIDYSGYPDCRPEFTECFQKTVNLGTGYFFKDAKLSIKAPFSKMRKHEIIKLGSELGVDFSLTHSCYNPTKEGKACGKCDSCKIRRDAFIKAGIKDTTKYAQDL